MDIGGRPSSRSRAGSTAANSPWRLAANSPASMSACGPGTPRVIRPARRILTEHIRRLAVAGRLRVSEQKAADLVHASGCGTVFTLLAMPEGRRDRDLPEAAREAVIAAITTGSPTLEGPGPAAAAIALRAVLPEATALTGGERRLLEEWLDRLAASRRESRDLECR
jgi:hypothetical protein